MTTRKPTPPQPTTDSISLRDFAGQVGLSLAAVQKAIATGRIPDDCVGTRAAPGGGTWPAITDPVRAAAAWGKDRDPAKVRDQAVLSAAGKAGRARRLEDEGARKAAAPAPASKPVNGKAAEKDSAPAGGGRPRSLVPPPEDDDGDDDSDDPGEWTAARWRKETARVKFESELIDLQVKRGQLVPAEMVKARYVKVVTGVRSRLLGVPTKAKAKIPHLTMRDIELLEDLIGKALQEMADG